MSEPARGKTREPTSDQLYGAGETFGACLNRFLYRSGLSLNALARQSFLDISYVSRLVNLPCDPLNRRPDDPYGVRWPGRDAVIRLAIAMQLNMLDTDELLQAAGYVTLVH